MTDFVLDASVTMAWCFEDETQPYTEGVLELLTEGEALVPSLWPLEVVNTLLVAERKGRLQPAQARRFLELLRSLPVVVEEESSPERRMGDLLALGRELRLSAYDAAYLELAARTGLPLATTDRDLVTAAEQAGVERVSPG